MKFEKEITYFNKEVENYLKNANVKGLYNSEQSLYLLLEKENESKKTINVVISRFGNTLLVNAPADMRYGIANYICLELIANSMIQDSIFPDFFFDFFHFDFLEIYDTSKKPQSFVFFSFPLPIKEEFPLLPISEQTVTALSELIIDNIIQRLKNNKFTNNFTKEELKVPENFFNFLYGIPYKNIYDISKIKETTVKKILESDIGRIAQMVHFFKDESGFDTRFYGNDDPIITINAIKGNLSFLSGIRTVLKKNPEIKKQVRNFGIHKKILKLEKN